MYLCIVVSVYLCIVVTVYGQLGYAPSYSGSHGDYAVVGCVK